MRLFTGYRRYGVGIFIMVMARIAQAQHGSVEYDKVVHYTLSNTPKLDAITKLLTNLFLQGQDEYRIGVIDETMIKDNDVRIWEEQTISIEEHADDYTIPHDLSFVAMSQQLSGLLTALETRIRRGEFDWKSEDDDTEEELKARYGPGVPFMRGPGPPFLDLIADMSFQISRLTNLNKLNMEILGTKITVPANFYQKDLDDRPRIPGTTQDLSIWDALILLMWDPRDKGEGTPLELATWIYAIEEGGNTAFYDVAGRYNMYLTVKIIYETLNPLSARLKDEMSSHTFKNVYEKKLYEFAPLWDLVLGMRKIIEFYRNQSLELILLLEALPTLMPAPIRPQIQGPQGGLN
ncbi:hypothetical protein TWF506_000046 [Arthrobotrys conoides]|uniref:Uncharacterized protein n=1 Tax=Arthrobotrys conoides TaxID=74498 RepID=A0AAN8PQC3_9PEZI